MEADKQINKYFRLERAKFMAVCALAVGAMLSSATNFFQSRTNNQLSGNLDCWEDVQSDRQAAISRGLVAVANGDDDALHEQSSILIQLNDQFDNCKRR